MIEFTCCVCGFKFTEATGDLDERMCQDCLDEFYSEVSGLLQITEEVSS